MRKHLLLLIALIVGMLPSVVSADVVQIHSRHTTGYTALEGVPQVELASTDANTSVAIGDTPLKILVPKITNPGALAITANNPVVFTVPSNVTISKVQIFAINGSVANGMATNATGPLKVYAGSTSTGTLLGGVTRVGSTTEVTVNDVPIKGDFCLYAGAAAARSIASIVITYSVDGEGGGGEQEALDAPWYFVNPATGEKLEDSCELEFVSWGEGPKLVNPEGALPSDITYKFLNVDDDEESDVLFESAGNIKIGSAGTCRLVASAKGYKDVVLLVNVATKGELTDPEFALAANGGLVKFEDWSMAPLVPGSIINVTTTEGEYARVAYTFDGTNPNALSPRTDMGGGQITIPAGATVLTAQAESDLFDNKTYTMPLTVKVWERVENTADLKDGDYFVMLSGAQALTSAAALTNVTLTNDGHNVAYNAEAALMQYKDGKAMLLGTDKSYSGAGFDEANNTFALNGVSNGNAYVMVNGASVMLNAGKGIQLFILGEEKFYVTNSVTDEDLAWINIDENREFEFTVANGVRNSDVKAEVTFKGETINFTETGTNPATIKISGKEFNMEKGELKITIPAGYFKVGAKDSEAAEYVYNVAGHNYVGLWMLNGQPVNSFKYDLTKTAEEQEVPVFVVNEDYYNAYKDFIGTPYLFTTTHEAMAKAYVKEEKEWDVLLEFGKVGKTDINVKANLGNGAAEYIDAPLAVTLVKGNECSPVFMKYKVGENEFEYVAGEVFPVSPGMSVKLYNEEYNSQVDYTVSYGDVTTEETTYRSLIEITPEMAGKTVKVTAVTRKYGMDDSEASEFTFDVKNWVVAENTAAYNKAEYFIAVAEKNGFYTIGSDLNPLAIETRSGKRVIDYQNGMLLFAKDNAKAKILNPADATKNYLTVSGTKFAAGNVAEAKSIYLNAIDPKVEYSASNIQFGLDGKSFGYNSGVNAFGNYTSYTDYLRVYVWGEDRDLNLSMKFNDEAISSMNNVPDVILPGSTLEVSIPYGYTASYTMGSKSESNLTGTATIVFDDADATNLNFQAVCDGYKTLSLSKDFAVKELKFTYYMVNEETGEATELENNNAVFKYGNLLRAVAPEGTEYINYTLTYNGGNKTFNPAVGEQVDIVLPRIAGINYTYSFTAVNEAGQTLVKNATFTAFIDEAASNDEQNNVLDYTQKLSFKASTEEDVEWLTEGGRTVTHHHGTTDGLYTFVPGGENKIAHIGEEGYMRLLVENGSMFRIGLNDHTRIVSLTITGENLQNVRIGRTNHNGDVHYANEFIPVGTIERDLSGTSLKWTFNMFDEFDCLGVEIWNGTASAKNAPRRAAQASESAAKIAKIAVGTDVSTAVEGIEAVDSDVRYFDMNGVEVNADRLQRGIYIRVSGGKATKVMVK